MAATFKVHLDGYNQLDYLTGKHKTGPRTEFAYFDDDGDLVAFRHGDWKSGIRGAEEARRLSSVV